MMRVTRTGTGLAIGHKLRSSRARRTNARLVSTLDRCCCVCGSGYTVPQQSRETTRRPHKSSADNTATARLHLHGARDFGRAELAVRRASSVTIQARLENCTMTNMTTSINHEQRSPAGSTCGKGTAGTAGDTRDPRPATRQNVHVGRNVSVARPSARTAGDAEEGTATPADAATAAGSQNRGRYAASAMAIRAFFCKNGIFVFFLAHGY